MVQRIHGRSYRVHALTSKRMQELDRIMVGEYHIELLVMMENAGRALALLAKRFLNESVERKRILVMAGKGNNGGGGLASARHLHNWGANVEVILSSPRNDLAEAPAKQLRILEKMHISIHEQVNEIRTHIFALIIDSLLGYNQMGNPRGRVADLVEFANASCTPILSLDIPTGLDPNTGRHNNPCIKAIQTLTLAIPKVGLLRKQARPYVGEVFLTDISVPRKLYMKFGIARRSMFSQSTILQIDPEKRVFL
jgi:NAD(P)H-hydrate epimerase